MKNRPPLLWLAGVLLSAFVSVNPVQSASFPTVAFPDGVAVNTGTKLDGLTNQDMQLAQAAGVKYFRIDMTWSEVEQTVGVYTWTKFDTLLARMDTYGIKPLFLLTYTRSGYNTDAYTMNEVAERQGFAAFAAAAVARYEHQRSGTIWELWNEQNTSPFWNVPGDNTNNPTSAVERAKVYMQFIDAVVPAMRAANPNATIISGGVINAAWNATTAWFQECFSKGLLSKVDGLGVHVYGGNSNLKIERVPNEIVNLRSLIVANGGSPTMPILNTEYGVATTEFGGDLTLQRTEQAAIAARSFIMGHVAGMPLNCWYEWRTGGPMSLFDNSFNARPAYTATSVMSAQLAGYTYESRKNIGSSNDYAMVFVNGSQRKLVLWTTDPAHTVNFPVTGGTSFTTTSMLGTTSTATTNGGILSVGISSRPVYITLGTAQMGTTASEGLVTQDIGTVGFAGSAGVNAGNYWVRGSGNDIYGNSDNFRFVYQPMSGNVTLTARVLSLGASHGDARSGVMIREFLTAGSRHASTFMNPAGKAQFFRRATANGTTSVTDSSTVAPHWVRIARNGDQFTSSRSADGITWTTIGTVTLTNSPATMYVGLVACSHSNSQLTTAAYDNVTPDISVPDLPLTYQDVGSPALAGTTTATGSGYTLTAGGVDIWGSSDQFHFVHEPITGNGVIIARVTGVQNTHQHAKAGVMIRESLTGGSRNAFTIIHADGTSRFQRRTASGGTTSSTAPASGVTGFPRWVKMERSGDKFISSISSNGVTWEQIGNVTMTGMAPTIYAGLAATSHNAAQLSTSAFDNVVFPTEAASEGTNKMVTNPYARVEAESYDAQKGTLLYVGASAQKVGDITNGDWTEYQNVDFGAGAATFSARVSSNTSGGTLQVRLGTPTGTLLGSVAVSSTGGWENFVDVQTTVTGATGRQTICLVFVGGTGALFDLDYFQFAQ